mgnify:CR=1 FL=1
MFSLTSSLETFPTFYCPITHSDAKFFIQVFERHFQQLHERQLFDQIQERMDTWFNDDAEENAKIIGDRKCPKCESELIVREGKYGKFIGCENFPECKYIEKIQKKILLIRQQEKATLRGRWCSACKCSCGDVA